MAEHHEDHSHGTLGQLITGFVLAAILTIVPFALVMSGVEINRLVLMGIIMLLAAIQIIVHLVYFLHLKSNVEQGWTVAATVLAIIILVIILVGSLWVMHNMNENMMPPMDHSTMPAADHGAAPEMDHSNMPGMDHSNMSGMDHSNSSQPAQ